MKRFPVRLRTIAGRVGTVKPCRWAPTQATAWCCRIGAREWIGFSSRRWGSSVVAVQPYQFGNPPTLGDLPKWISDMQKRKVPTGDTPGKLPQASLTTKVLLKYQNLVQHLAVTQYDDGSPRQAGMLVLFTNGVAWRAVIKDPDTSAKLVVTQETLDDLLGAAELLLGSPDTMWEPDQNAQPRAKGRAKK